jgi:hypothetical protein
VDGIEHRGVVPPAFYSLLGFFEKLLRLGEVE